MKEYKVIDLPTLGKSVEESGVRRWIAREQVLNQFAKQGYKLVAVQVSVAYLEKDV